MSKSTRMGIAFSIVAISLLLGTPIEGALLHMRSAEDGFLWLGSIIFCGVGFVLFFLQSSP
jgi:MFS transporter, MCT family, solute carrier family 16 (monocarboxylic acid transporters), member 10